MITWYVIDAEGEDYVLGVATSWSVYHGLGTPCDKFEIELSWQGSDLSLLESACRVRVEQDGAVMFTGVVDECEWKWNDAGAVVTITGRGMGALLLDNEAQGVDFTYATLDGVLSRYVTPYGISVASRASMSGVSDFSVSTGSSAWSVLYDFVRYYGGICPRFTKEGALNLSAFSDAVVFSIVDATTVLELERRYQRYGVLSKVLVINKTESTSQTVSDGELLDNGFCASSVVSVPRGTGSSSMRYTGNFQLNQSKNELLEITLTLAGAFGAYPGDVVQVSLGEAICQGSYRVQSCESSMDSDGYRCALRLAPLDVIP